MECTLDLRLVLAPMQFVQDSFAIDVTEWIGKDMSWIKKKLVQRIGEELQSIWEKIFLGGPHKTIQEQQLVLEFVKGFRAPGYFASRVIEILSGTAGDISHGVRIMTRLNIEGSARFTFPSKFEWQVKDGPQYVRKLDQKSDSETTPYGAQQNIELMGVMGEKVKMFKDLCAKVSWTYEEVFSLLYKILSILFNSITQLGSQSNGWYIEFFCTSEYRYLFPTIVLVLNLLPR